LERLTGQRLRDRDNVAETVPQLGLDNLVALGLPVEVSIAS
jgi:hypothetical protein